MERVLPYFFDEAPEFEARDGIMFMRWPELEICAPISVCIKSVGKCKRELARWERQNASVIPLSPPEHG